MRVPLHRHGPRLAALLAFTCCVAALGVSGAGALRLVAAQQTWRLPEAQGVITVELTAEGRPLLLGQPVAPDRLLALARSASRRPGWRAVRLVPAPTTDWGAVLGWARRLDAGGVSVDVQLPRP